MAFGSYPRDWYVKTHGTGEIVQCGGATFPSNCELAAFYVTMYMKGARGAAEKIRALLYTDDDYSKVYATGEWSNLVEANDGATNWIGRVLLSFDPYVNIEAGTPYYVGIEASGYTKNLDTSYIAYSYDWPFAINATPDAPFYGVQMDFRIRKLTRY